MIDSDRDHYTLLEHTADVKIRARGDSFALTLRHLAGGLFDILYDAAPAGEKNRRTLSVEAWDRASLVVNFLNELLYWIEEELIHPTAVNVLAVSDRGLTFILEWQEAQTPPAYEIKAATYHDLVVEDHLIEVVFDL